MDRNETESLPADLADVAHRLRDERPQASPLELDRMKLQARSRARRRTARRESVMRSRLAITSMLVVGVLMSGAGAGLAVSGVSGSGSSGDAQYPTTTTTTVTTQEVLPTTESTDTQTVAPTTETNVPTDTSASDPAQATRQVETNDGDTLPFTGYAAIPVLLAGIALLTAGMIMRRRMAGDNQS